MEGYDVVTTDAEKVGKVVGTHGDHLIVEQGTIRKSKHALPRTFAAVDDSERVVRMTIGKQIFCNSPKVNGEVDEVAIADYYGLAGGSEAPPTEGWGESLPDDPSRGSETQAERDGVTPAPQERAEMRKQMVEGGSGLPDESPGALTDRLAGVDEHEQEKR